LTFEEGTRVGKRSSLPRPFLHPWCHPYCLSLFFWNPGVGDALRLPHRSSKVERPLISGYCTAWEPPTRPTCLCLSGYLRM